MGSSYPPKDLIVKILLLSGPEDVFGVCYDHRLRMIPFFWGYKAVIQKHVRAEYWKHVKQHLKDYGYGKLNQYHFCRLSLMKNMHVLSFLVDNRHYDCRIDVLFTMDKTLLLVEISHQNLKFEITKAYIRENGFLVLTGIKF